MNRPHRQCVFHHSRSGLVDHCPCRGRQDAWSGRPYGSSPPRFPALRDEGQDARVSRSTWMYESDRTYIPAGKKNGRRSAREYRWL